MSKPTIEAGHHQPRAQRRCLTCCALPLDASYRGSEIFNSVMRIQFAGFLVDSSTRQVLRDGTPIHLSPKALQLLLILIQAAPRALGKRELLERIWPETFVSESSLGNVVAELRRALRDRSPSGFVRTIHGFGYA